jgi:hypothetical protein
VVCVESRQAYQTLKSLEIHKTDRNETRGLAHWAGTGFFKLVHVKSVPRARHPFADRCAQEAKDATSSVFTSTIVRTQKNL